MNEIELDNSIICIKNEVKSVLEMIQEHSKNERLMKHKLDLVIDELCKIRLKTRNYD